MGRTLGRCPHTISVVSKPLVNKVGGMNRLFNTKGVFLPRIIGATHAVGGTITVLRPTVRTRGISSSSTGTKGILFTAIGNSIRSVKGGVISVILTYGGCRIVSLKIVIPTSIVMGGTVRRGPSLIYLSNLVAPSLRRVIRIASRVRGTNLDVPVVINNTAASGLRATVGVTPRCSCPIVRILSTSRGPLVTTGLLGPSAHSTCVTRLGDRCRTLHTSIGGGGRVLIPLTRTQAGHPIVS